VLLPQAARAPWLEQMLALLGLTGATGWLPDEPVSCASMVVTGRLGHAEVSPLARQSAQALVALVPMSPAGPTRLYLRSAEAAGRLLNEPLVAATLAARGFTLVDADRTPLAERIALLRHASAVVAAQGGPLAEMAFCPGGAAVLELLGPADPSALYWSLASVSGLRYGYVVGEASGAATPGCPFQIPLPMLEQAAALLPS
jgi:capsular polysaccharide biosynthesis protein